MFSFGFRALRISVMLVTIALLASCAPVMESARLGLIGEFDPAPRVTCNSQLGSYALPKNFMRVQVHRVTTNSVTEFVLSSLDTLSRGDSRHTFCLDYLASAFAQDRVIVKKSGGSGTQLLQVVASKTVDQSAVIIRRFIQTAFVAIGNFGFRKLGTSEEKQAEPVADLEFDPFDQVQSAYANDTLRKYGFCLVLEEYTFGRDPMKLDSRGGPPAHTYCRDPLAVAVHPTPFAAIYADLDKTEVPPVESGIVYRPRSSYQLHIYGKDDPKGPEYWKLRVSQPVFLVNLSPVLAIRVDRNIFATKRIALKLEDGVLRNVCIFKTSELLEAIEIPLEVVKAVVRLPTQVIQVQYNQIKNETTLLTAETALINEQKKYIALLQGVEEAATATTPPSALGEPDKTKNVVVIAPPKTDTVDLNTYATGCEKAATNLQKGDKAG
jgi:hypothetical protein